MQRTGKINDPSFRLVVTEHTRGPRAHNIVEKVGTYYPKTKHRTLNEERVKHWLSMGAKPSDTVHNMLVSLGIIKGKKINVLPAYKEPEKAEETAAPAAEEAAPAETPAAADAEGSGEPKEEVKEEAPAEEPAKEETPIAADAEGSGEPTEEKPAA